MIAVLLLVVVASTVWVGFDSTGRDWSEWFIGCLLLWIIVFPEKASRPSQQHRGCGGPLVYP
jgi:hypothetical protein